MQWTDHRLRVQSCYVLGNNQRVHDTPGLRLRLGYLHKLDLSSRKI